MSGIKEIVEISGCKKELKFEIPLETIEGEFEKIVGDVAKHAAIPGFRHGKAPKNLIRKKFSKEIEAQLLSDFVPKAIDSALKEKGMQILGEPVLKDIDYRENEPFTFSAIVEENPKVEPKDYTGFEITVPQPQAVTDEQVNRDLEVLRENGATFVPVEEGRPARQGDYVLVDMATREERGKEKREENVLFHVGDESNPKEFNEKLFGLSGQEPFEFEITYPPPKDSPEGPSRKVHYRLVLKGIKDRKVPNLDDEFAKTQGDYQGLDDLKNEIRRQLEKRALDISRRKKMEKIRDKLLDAQPFEIPEFYVDHILQDRIRNLATNMVHLGVDIRSPEIQWEKIREEQREASVRDAKWYFLLDRIAEKENLAATEEDFKLKLEEFSKELNKSVDYASAQLGKEEHKLRIMKEIQRHKVIDFLLDHVTIRTQEISQ